MFTIGKLARQADVSADTVRYYEQQGLRPLPWDARYRLFLVSGRWDG